MVKEARAGCGLWPRTPYIPANVMESAIAVEALSLAHTTGGSDPEANMDLKSHSAPAASRRRRKEEEEEEEEKVDHMVMMMMMMMMMMNWRTVCNK